MRRLRLFTWHIHGSYLYYLSHLPCEIILPVKPEGGDGYHGRTSSYPWPDNVTAIPVDEVRNQSFDCILYQSHGNYLRDQHEILTPAQRNLPRVYLEHDPPREHPTDTRHPVDDPNVLVVHVTHFNRLMWDAGRSPTHVIEHGVTTPRDIRYSGDLPRGIVVVNNIHKRGRRLGEDVFLDLRRSVPLDLVGMGWQEVDGLGEIPHDKLPEFSARYRFFFNPIRYTSLGLAVCEAMMLGMPIVGLATTEMVTVVENGVSGYLHTDPRKLEETMRQLIADPALARMLGDGARRTALERFSLDRFVRDWQSVLEHVTGLRRLEGAAAPSASRLPSQRNAAALTFHSGDSP